MEVKCSCGASLEIPTGKDVQSLDFYTLDIFLRHTNEDNIGRFRLIQSFLDTHKPCRERNSELIIDLIDQLKDLALTPRTLANLNMRDNKIIKIHCKLLECLQPNKLP